MRRALIGLALVVATSGCATIVRGSTQEVPIGSTPTGARVSIGGRDFGTTPVIVRLPRKESTVVRLELEGYEPFEVTLARRTSRWVWADVLLGGVAFAVDASSGAIYDLTPAQIATTMAPRGTGGASRQEDDLYVLVVLKPGPDWRRVGTPTPER